MLASIVLTILKAIGRVRRNPWIGFMATAWTLVFVQLLWLAGSDPSGRALVFGALLLVGALVYTWGYMREDRRENNEVQALAIGPAVGPALETHEIVSLYETGDVNNALRATESALATRPRDPSLWSTWARCKAANDETRMATRGIDRALQHDPQHVEALYLLAWSRRFYWDYRGARRAASTGLVVDPAHAGLRFELSEAKRMISQWTRAKALTKHQPMSARSTSSTTSPSHAPQTHDTQSPRGTIEATAAAASFTDNVLELNASPVTSKAASPDPFNHAVNPGPMVCEPDVCEPEAYEPVQSEPAERNMLEPAPLDTAAIDDSPLTIEVIEETPPTTSPPDPVESETELFDSQLFVNAILDSERFESTPLLKAPAETSVFEPAVAAPAPRSLFEPPQPETPEPTVSQADARRPIKHTAGSRLEQLVNEANAACARVQD